MRKKVQSLAKSALLKDSVIYLAGELLSKAMPFLLLPYLTRMLGTDGFGELSYYLAIGAFLLIFMSLSQNGAITRYYYVYGKNGLGNLLLAGGLYSFAIFLLGVVISILQKSEGFFYCVLISFLQSLVQNQLALRQCQKRPFSYFAIQISLAITNVIFTVGLFYWLNNNYVIERLLAIILSYFITFIGAILLLKKTFDIRIRPTLKRLKLAIGYIITFGLPLILHALSYTVKGQFDRVLINERFSAHELGVYSAGVQVASVVTVLIMAVNSAGVPYLYERLKTGKIQLAHLHRAFWFSLAVPIVVTLFAYLLPLSLFTFVLGEAFAPSRFYTVFFVFAFSLTIPYLILVNYLFYHAKTAQISACSVISTVVYLLVLWWASVENMQFVPLASVISTAILLPLLYYFTKQIDKKK